MRVRVMSDDTAPYVRSVARFSDVSVDNLVLKNSKKNIKNVNKNEISCQTDRYFITSSSR